MMQNKILAKELGSELMLYDTEADEVHVLNPTAKLVYEFYKKGTNPTEIEQRMREKFQVDSGQDLHADVMRCLEELRSKQLLGS